MNFLSYMTICASFFAGYCVAMWWVTQWHKLRFRLYKWRRRAKK